MPRQWVPGRMMFSFVFFRFSVNPPTNSRQTPETDNSTAKHMQTHRVCDVLFSHETPDKLPTNSRQTPDKLPTNSRTGNTINALQVFICSCIRCMVSFIRMFVGYLFVYSYFRCLMFSCIRFICSSKYTETMVSY